MSDGENLNCFIFLAIDNCERKSLKNESSSAVVTGGPTLWRFTNWLQSAINCFGESESGWLAPLHVPQKRRFEFHQRVRVNVNVLGGH